MSKVWEPVENDVVIPTGAPDSDGRDTTIGVEYNTELWGEKQSLLIITFDDDGRYTAGITLPEGYAICRLVDAPEVPTAQEMYWTMLHRTRELNAQGFDHLQALAMAFGEYITAHPEIERPMGEA